MNIYKFIFLVSFSLSLQAVKDKKDPFLFPPEDTAIMVPPKPPVDPKTLSDEDRKVYDKTNHLNSITHYVLKHMYDINVND